MDEIYPIVPAAFKAVWLLAAIGVLLLVVALSLAVVAYASSHTRVRVDVAGLHVEGDPFFGRDLPWSHLESERTQVVRVDGEAPHRAVRRRFGTGMPGYAAGWFRLASGEKALVFLTGAPEAVYVPTRSGWGLLVTVDQPEALAERIRGGSAGS